MSVYVFGRCSSKVLLTYSVGVTEIIRMWILKVFAANFFQDAEQFYYSFFQFSEFLPGKHRDCASNPQLLSPKLFISHRLPANLLSMILEYCPLSKSNHKIFVLFFLLKKELRITSVCCQRLWRLICSCIISLLILFAFNEFSLKNKIILWKINIEEKSDD